MSQARTAFAAYRSATEATVSKQRIVQMLFMLPNKRKPNFNKPNSVYKC